MLQHFDLFFGKLIGHGRITRLFKRGRRRPIARLAEKSIAVFGCERPKACGQRANDNYPGSIILRQTGHTCQRTMRASQNFSPIVRNVHSITCPSERPDTMARVGPDRIGKDEDRSGYVKINTQCTGQPR
jgi:hypothetical protein